MHDYDVLFDGVNHVWNDVVIIFCYLNDACFMMACICILVVVNSNCVELDLQSQYPYPVV